MVYGCKLAPNTNNVIGIRRSPLTNAKVFQNELSLDEENLRSYEVIQEIISHGYTSQK